MPNPNRRLALSFSLTLAALLTGWICAARLAATRQQPFSKQAGESFYDQPREAAEFFQRKRLPAGATELPINRYFEALEAMRTMPQYSSADGLTLPSRAQLRGRLAEQQLGAWTPLGPGNIGGRTRALLIHPNNPSLMYAAGVSGGVWRTTDGGANWAPVADLIANIAVNALAMDSTNPNVLYAGTGEGFFNLDSVRGAGIFKTTDGGTSWTRLMSTTTADFHFVNDIAVSPVNAQRVYAATSTGIWRSTNGGTSWMRVLTTAANGGCFDLTMRSDKPTDFVFASCGTAANSSALVAATIYRNLDAGEAGTWDSVFSEAGMGRTSLALAPSNQNIVYALAASGELNANRHGLFAVFRSLSSGDLNSWTARVRNTNSTKLNTVLLSNPFAAFYGDCGFTPSGPNFPLGQGWYDNVIAVDPVDANRVWVGGIDLFRSDDGGASWGLASYWWANGGLAPLAPQYVHADQHAIVFHPQYNGTTNRTMFVGNDGGIFRTTDARAPLATGGAAACNPAVSGVLWTPLNNNYGVTQFYHGLSYPNGASYFGGTQDNGTLRGMDATGVNNWREILGGDGGYVAVDPSNTNILYAANTGISIQKSTNGGANFVPATDGIVDSGLFISPYVMDPSEPRRLWTGGTYLWRTTNGAASWTRASAITAGRGLVSAIAVAPTNANFVLAGMSDGFILRTDIGLTSTSTTTWANVQPRIGHVSWVAFDPTNKDIAYATYATFGGVHVWRSTNGGASWTGIDGAGAGVLPDIPVHCIVIDPLNTARLYIGTDLGVFVSTNGGASWAVENTGFANVVVESLNLNVVNGVTTLFAFTHGRGTWRVTANQTGCLFALAPTSQAFAGAGGTGTINVTATPAGCSWTATSSATWITINSGASGNGNGTVNFTVAANTTTAARTGTITAAGRTFTITQQGCATVTPTFQYVEATGGTGSINISAAATCSWTVTNPDNWIMLNSPGSGNGNATVNFTVAANTANTSRSSTLTVAGQTFTVLQAGTGGACASTGISAGQALNGALALNDCRSLARGSTFFADRYTFNGQAGQQIVIGLAAARFDAYLYLLDANGAIVTQGNDGGGGVNESDARIPETGSFFTLPAAGTYTIEVTTAFSNRTGNYTLSLSAGAANCSFTLAATSQTFGINGGTGSAMVMAGSGCAWQAVAQTPWITLNSGANSSGPGTVGFTVAANNTIGPRTGTIIVAGQVYTVMQAGLPATYRAEWRGTTSAGLPIRFQVDANDMLVYLEVDVRVSFFSGTCIYTLFSTEPVPIENGQFAVPLIGSGLFFSSTPFARGTLTANAASGQVDDLRIGLAFCGSTIIFTSTTASGPSWNVQRQVLCPTVSGLDQTSGPVGASVVITGANLMGVSAVKFANNVNASFAVNSDTQITATVPASATTGPITISKTGCADVQSGSFTVTQCPTVSSLNPTRGLVGSTVTITGANLDGVTAVRFAGGVAAQFTANSATQITATVPAGAMNGPITLSRSGCPDVQTASFTVCAPITITPTTLPDGPGGVAYSQTLTGSGGTAPYSFAVTAGVLSGGLTLTTGGVLAGTPNVAGTFNFTVTATDANGCTGSRSYTVNITVTLGAQTRALYVLNDNPSGNQIYGYAVNETSGALILLSGFPISTGGAGQGSTSTPPGENLVIDRTNQRLYAINAVSNTVSAYAINPMTGALTPLSFSPISLGSGRNFVTIAVHSSGSPLLIGDGTDAPNSRLLSYQITATTATAATGSPYNTGTVSPASTAFSQDGNYVYTGGNSGTVIAGFSVNVATGVLTTLVGSPFDVGGTNPFTYAYATDAAGRLFVANYDSGQVRVFTTASGIPSAVSGNPFTSSLTNAIYGLLHPNGFYLVADRSGNRIGVYRISGSGSATTLAAVTGSPFATGGTATNVLALNQTGTLLFAANASSRNLTTFSINPATGALIALGTQSLNTLGTSGGITGMAYFAQPCPTITLSPATLPSGTIGTAYNQPITAVPAANYNYSITAGALPAGLSLNSTTGALTGTPTAAGTFNFTITALSFGPCSGSQSYTLTINNPAPALASLNPMAATAGSGALTLTVTGSNFVNNSVVRWNGADRQTTFVSATQLTATIPASDLATASTASVTVFTPAPGGGTSGALTFTINNPVPTTAALNPALAIAGNAGFTLTVTGTNFVNGSVVRWNNADRQTNFVSATQLTAQIPASDLASVGSASVTVFNPAPGGGTSNAQTFTVNNPAPTLTALNPNATTAGGQSFTLSVTGTNFVNGSLVRWNGSDRATTFVSNTQLTATISTADIATAGTSAVTVFNPAPGGGTSGALTFTINNPLPTLAALNPNSALVGGAAFTLNVTGTNFVNGSVVRWNGSDRATTFVSSTQLTAAIPASDLAAAGTANVAVFNPAPGGGTSNAQSFIVNNPVPTLTSITPSTAMAGAAAFTLTLNGANFISSSVVRWNGSDRPTTLVNSTQLSAAIPASDVATAGTANITVFNPAPGGGTSAAVTFTVNNPQPTLTQLNPISATAGGAAFTLTVTGTNFVSGSTVRWNGNNRTTNFVSSTQLTAAIPATDIALPGTASVTVANSAPGGGVSNALSFAINSAVVSLSAASFSGVELAPDSIIAAFGADLATQTVGAMGTPLPTTLGGTTVRVRDSAGMERLASLFFVSANQVNYLMPPGTAPGAALVTITNSNGKASVGTAQLAAVAPGLFTANANGQGVPAAIALRIKADGSQSFELVAQFDAAVGRFVPVPIDLGPEGEQVFLILFGTGFRALSALTNATAQIGGANADVSFAGAQGDLAGLDQANVRIPRSLIGRGAVDAVLTVEGKAANTVRIALK